MAEEVDMAAEAAATAAEAAASEAVTGCRTSEPACGPRIGVSDL